MERSAKLSRVLIIVGATDPCTGIGTTISWVRGQRSAAVRSMSARAELGTLVSTAMEEGWLGSGL